MRWAEAPGLAGRAHGVAEQVAVDSASTWTFTWHSRPGATCAVEGSTDLLEWSAVGASVPSAGITTTASRAAPTPPAVRPFYRVRQVSAS